MLTDKEVTTLAALIYKMEWPLQPSIFHALMEKMVSVPIELGVFNQDGHILLIHRDDHEFADCWHMPGTVLRDTDTVDHAVGRLLTAEIAGADVSDPIDLGWFEAGRDLTPSRHAISLLYACQVNSAYAGPGSFFPLDELPQNILIHHRIMAPMIYQRALEKSLLS